MSETRRRLVGTTALERLPRAADMRHEAENTIPQPGEPVGRVDRFARYIKELVDELDKCVLFIEDHHTDEGRGFLAGVRGRWQGKPWLKP